MSPGEGLHALSAGIGIAVGARVTAQVSPLSAEVRLIPLSVFFCAPPLNLDDFIVHGETPLTVEAKRHTIGTSVITNERHLFIRNNLPLPDRAITRDPNAWTVKVEGVAEAGRSASLSSRRSPPHCRDCPTMPGNGRAFYTHGPSGSQWATGAAGCVIWSGVKVSDVVNALGGVVGQPSYLTSTGGDPIPEGIDPLSVIVERSVPIKKALADGLLAWEMNGRRSRSSMAVLYVSSSRATLAAIRSSM